MADELLMAGKFGVSQHPGLVSFERVGDNRFLLAEGILWDDILQCLWWTDIFDYKLYRYDVASKKQYCWSLPARLGSFALTTEPNVLLLALEKSLVWFNVNTHCLQFICHLELDFPHNRANDGRCDPAGNFVFGTMSEGKGGATGRFYRYHPQTGLQVLALPACRIANGICFSPNGDKMYYTDSPQRRLWVCNYDPILGVLDEPKLFYDIRGRYKDTKCGVADGSIVDESGCVWNAEWGTGKLVCYSSTGQWLQEIRFPTPHVSCVILGGPLLDTFYITSASVGLSQQRAKEDKLAGHIFSCCLNITGRKEPRVPYLLH